MPKIAIDYSKTQMYKLKHKDDLYDENVYVGHTTNWIQRKANHKKSCNSENHKEYNEKKYVFIRENGGWDEWDMYWIENYPCNNEREARAKEEEWRTHFNAMLNDRRAFTSNEIVVAEQKTRSAKWYEKNKDKKKEKSQICMICECGETIRKCNLPRHSNSKKHIYLMEQKNKN